MDYLGPVEHRSGCTVRTWLTFDGLDKELMTAKAPINSVLYFRHLITLIALRSGRSIADVQAVPNNRPVAVNTRAQLRHQGGTQSDAPALEQHGLWT